MFFCPFRVRQAAWALLLTLGSARGAAAQHAGHHPPAAAAAPADRPSTHGMLVFGTRHVLASHLPMFHSPHHYQVLLELTLPDSARTAYAASRRAFPAETVYTLEPETFVLPEMVAHPRPFRGTLYRGHFERGGAPIARNVQVRIRQVLYFEPLRPDAPPRPRAEFLLVGDAAEQFLVHRIEGRPDFDQVLTVAPAPNAAVPVAPQAPATCRRWQQTGPNPRHPAKPDAAPLAGTAAETGAPLPLHLGANVYLEFDDLR